MFPLHLPPQCTCRPYLIFGIEEAVKCAQRGGVGVVVYFRKVRACRVYEKFTSLLQGQARQR